MPTAIDIGVTSLVPPVPGVPLDDVRAFIDARFGIAIDDEGVEIRRPWWTTTLAWQDIEEVVLDNRIDRVAQVVVGLLPVTRLPVAGRLLVSSMDTITEHVTRRLAPAWRDRAGWTVAEFVRPGWRPDVDLSHALGVTALLRQDLTEAVVAQADAHDVPVRRT